MERMLFQADNTASVHVSVSQEQGLCLLGLTYLPPSSTCAFVFVERKNIEKPENIELLILWQWLSL